MRTFQNRMLNSVSNRMNVSTQRLHKASLLCRWSIRTSIDQHLNLGVAPEFEILALPVAGLTFADPTKIRVVQEAFWALTE